MMYSTRLVALALAGAFATAACGDDGGDANPGADAGPVADADVSEPDASEPEPDAMPELTELERLCAPDGAVVGLYQLWAECQPFLAYYEAVYPDAFSGESLSTLCTITLGGYVEDGTVALDEDAAAACLEWQETAACEHVDASSVLPTAPGTPCDGILVGSVPTGSDCEMDAQCAGDAYCGTETPRGVAPCNVCNPRLADGQDCQSDAQCSSGACKSDGTCGPPGEVGDSCTAAGDCHSALECDLGLGQCVRTVPREGMGCDDHGDCGLPMLSLYCDLADTGTCKRMPQPGEPCLHDIGGQATMCDPMNYVWCSPVDDTCKEPDITQEGQPCNFMPTVGSGALLCDEGLACTDPQSTTEDGRPAGVCYRPRQPGESCGMQPDGTDQCQLFYGCTEGVCTPETGYTGMCPGPEPL